MLYIIFNQRVKQRLKFLFLESSTDVDPGMIIMSMFGLFSIILYVAICILCYVYKRLKPRRNRQNSYSNPNLFSYMNPNFDYASNVGNQQIFHPYQVNRPLPCQISTNSQQPPAYGTFDCDLPPPYSENMKS